ncbi:MAG: histidine kinase [Bacteroidetes bacterium]|nr:histidine kinase [Bacteroidota bacterium]
MKRLFIHSPYFRLLAPPVFGTMVYTLILLIHNQVGQLGTLFSNQEVYVSMCLTLISFESMRLSILIAAKIRIIANALFIRTMIATLVSTGLVLIAISTYYRLIIGFEISLTELFTFGVIFILTAVLYNVLYAGNLYIMKENTSRLEHERKLRENLESAFHSFRQEINPDLLYDSLEELILCMHRDTDTAEELIDSLASLYRYQLVHRQKEFVSLDEELSALRHLLRLANQKHQGQINWVNEITGAGDIQIVPGALITATDSIIRNTLISEQSPLTLTLTREDEEYLVLHHVLNDRLMLHAESLDAFQRLQRSYSVYSDKPFIQVKAGHENYVKFPLITLDHTVAVAHESFT